MIDIEAIGRLLPLVQVVFLTLKLTAVVDWSWWWVMAPTWIPLTGIAGFLLIVAIIALIVRKWGDKG